MEATGAWHRQWPGQLSEVSASITTPSKLKEPLGCAGDRVSTRTPDSCPFPATPPSRRARLQPTFRAVSKCLSTSEVQVGSVHEYQQQLFTGLSRVCGRLRFEQCRSLGSAEAADYG